MGILDDAIREHLDLKRRRGADPAEVERAEREALGPVRRNPSPGEDAAAQEGGLAYDQAGDEGWSQDALQEPTADAGVELAYDEPPRDGGPAPEFPAAPAPEFSAAPAPAPFDDAPDPVAEDDGEADRDEPAHGPFPAAPAPMGHAGPETAEYDVEDALAAEDERGQTDDSEDVLEETPEFLQDTPDHDRLWFEQRPPKDFDFDE